MPRVHKPICFKEPGISDLLKERLEDYIYTHPKTYSATKVLFALVAVGGALTFAAAAPGLVGVLGKSYFAQKRDRRERYDKLWQSFYRLKKERAIEYVGEKDGKPVYAFTENGKTKLHKFLLDTLKIATPSKWDGKWRIVLFDIPEKIKSRRRAIQQKFAELGLYPMQKSAWVHPFPCEAEVEFLKDVYGVKPHVYTFLVSEMPSGRALYHFSHLLKEIL